MEKFRFLAPCELCLFKVEQGSTEELELAGKNLPKGKFVEAGEICLRKVNEMPELVLPVHYDGRDYFVVVCDIDEKLDKLCERWLKVYNTFAGVFAESEEPIKEALQRHRMKLRVVH